MNKQNTSVHLRESTQELAPVKAPDETKGTYSLYPAFELGEGRITHGYEHLAHIIKDFDAVVIDGYIGVFWNNLRSRLESQFSALDIQVNWVDVSEALKSEDEISDMIAPYLGGDDPIFGTRFDGELSDFFHKHKLDNLNRNSGKEADLTILYGCGAALAGWKTPLIYMDLPKNELQFRSRAQKVGNLGKPEPDDPKKMYKRFYFVDWIALNEHKKEILPHINWIVDEQRPNEPAIMKGEHFREALHEMSQNYFRVRPWFEPGVWGGQWCKEHIPQLPEDVPNYAWSFEMISPENGLMFSSDDYLMETSFDWLMYQENDAILGESANQFGYEFPIRFDFLDTFDGGNLSVQCHPRPSFIKSKFGESFTQNETYYMLDCKPDAQVYLGFQADIDSDDFRTELEQSAQHNTPVDVKKYVQTFTAHKHDLFLIPHSTIHCSGTDNLVLEISATPYIFTFKMYDWLRLDLNSQPRPLNIERAFKNLNFDYKGKRVEEELISKPAVLEEGDKWRIVHLPTHEKHFYDVHRLEFTNEIEVNTDGSCQVMSLVEGDSVKLETANGMQSRFNFAETFAVPAAAGNFRLINEGSQPAKVVKAFVKPGIKLDNY